MLRALRKLGFVVVRQRGSHILLRHPDGRSTVVPQRGGRDLDRKLVGWILEQIGVEWDDLGRLL